MELAKGIQTMFKNLFTTSLYVEKQSVPVGTISGKVTKKGVQVGDTKSSNKYARITLAVSSTDYDVKHAEYVLSLKDKKLFRSGDKSDKYPLLFIDVVAFGRTADFLEKNIKAGDMVRVMGTIEAREYNDKVSVSMVASELEKDFGAKDTVADSADDALQAQNDMDVSEEEFSLASDDLPF